MGLSLRDVAVLFSCALLLYLSLSGEGDLSLEAAFFQPIELHAASSTTSSGTLGPDMGELMTSYANGIAPIESELVSVISTTQRLEFRRGRRFLIAETRWDVDLSLIIRLSYHTDIVCPAPLITDIDGDGTNEVVIVTREPKLKIFKFKANVNSHMQSFNTLYSHKGIDWEQLVLVREVGLLSSLLITTGRQIVGLSSGYLRPYNRHKNRKQVIVIVNESWGIFVFNHKLRLMWTRTIESDLSLKYLAEVAIMIDPHPMRRGGGSGSSSKNDTGVIVIGGRLGLKAELHKNAYGLHHEQSTQTAGPRALEFPADYTESLNGRVLRPGRGAKKNRLVSANEGETRDVEQDHSETLGTDPFHFERENHFSYYAFEGKSGDARWKHDSTSFLEETHPNEILRPQHEASHSGEMDWRVFRQSLLATALPHAWQGGRESTWFDLAHVEKTRSGHARQNKRKSRAIKSNFFVANALGMRPHKDTEHVLNPNAIIVHLKDGIEVLHLYSGRPLCRLTLKSGQVHVDMNGDGVVDHVEAVGGVHQTGYASLQARAENQHATTMPKCLAVVHSGIPQSRQLFNASICVSGRWQESMRLGLGSILESGSATNTDYASSSPQTTNGLAPNGGGRGGRSSGFSMEGSDGSTETPSTISNLASKFGNMLKEDLQGKQQLRVAHPIVIQEPSTVGKPTKKRRYHSFFYLNNGLVSSFNHDGSRTWHIQSKSNWLLHHATDDTLSTAEASFRPSLSPYSLHADSVIPADHVLAVGERGASLLSLAGHIRAEIHLARDLAVAPPIVGDFDNDGLNDFILVTTKGFYGYRLQRRMAGQLFSILVLALLLLLSLIFAFKLANSDTFNAVQSQADRMRQASLAQRNKTTFTGGLRTMTKSAKAQL